MRLAIIGVMCSGKTTIADYLVNNHNFRKLSFADDVKKYANEIFNLKNKNRRILQQFSSKMKEIDSDIWIKRLDIKLKMLNDNDNDNDNIVIDDLRFENELEYLKKNNFKFLKLEISDDLQLERLKKTYKDDYLEHYNCINHESEIIIKTLPYDYHYCCNDNDNDNDMNFINNIIISNNKKND